MNNLAIIIAESQYDSDEIMNLNMCINDANRIERILNKAGKYKKIIKLINNTRLEIYDRLNEIKIDEGINEILFYYSGHGYQKDGEFYYISRDTNINRINSTALKNKDIDDIIRNLKPNLFVKIIDACNSGSQYIKEISVDDEIKKALFNGQKGFNNCFFMFSSTFNQKSYADYNSSLFTKYLIKSLNITFKDRNIVKYRDVADEITDSFINDNRQKPYFVTQGFNDEIFLTKNSELIKCVSDLSIELENAINTSVKHEDKVKNACTKEEAVICRDTIFEDISSKLSNIDKLKINRYEVAKRNIQSSNVCFKKKLGEWINEYKSKNILFAEMIETGVWDSVIHFNTPPDRYEIISFRLNVEKEKSIMEMEYICNDYPLPKYSFQIVSIFSINYLYLIYGISKALPKNWEDYELYQELLDMRVRKVNMRNNDEFKQTSKDIANDVIAKIEKDLIESLSAYE